MFTSINSDYRNDINSWPEVEDQLHSIAKAGFSHVQWIHDWDGERMYTLIEMLQAKDALRNYGLKAHTLHADHGGERGSYIKGVWNPTPQKLCTKARKEIASLNEGVRLAGVELVKNRIELCSHIGASVMVIHLQVPWGYFREKPENKEEFYRAVYKTFDAVEPYARFAGVKIAVENLFNIPLDDEDEKFERLFDRYDPEYLGMCYDSGHASLSYVDNYYHLLEKFGHRLYATHLQDTQSIDPKYLLNDFKAVSQHDLHSMPFDGLLDWDIIAQHVAKAPMELPADFEVCCPELSPEEDFQWLLTCKERSERFHKMVAKYQEKG